MNLEIKRFNTARGKSVTDMEAMMKTYLPSLDGTIQEVAQRALTFVESQDSRLPSMMIRYQWFDGDPDDVINALAAYQNPDGGFGNRLEPDIHHPSSNAFAARMAMEYLLALPEDAGTEMKASLQTWLEENQHDDGDWHLSEESRSGFMQPWFAAWEHPNLNPACCVAGLAAKLGIATDSMLEKVARLFDEQASQDDVRNGEFYTLLPYIEYTAGVQLADADTWYDLLAERIVGMLHSGNLDDAEHFFTLALGGSTEITNRIPKEIIAGQVRLMLSEQQEDGGWPTPYDPAWRVLTTAGNMQTLARLTQD